MSNIKAKNRNGNGLGYNSWAPISFLTPVGSPGGPYAAPMGLNMKFTHVSYTLTNAPTVGLSSVINLISGYTAANAVSPPTTNTSYGWIDFAGVFVPGETITLTIGTEIPYSYNQLLPFVYTVTSRDLTLEELVADFTTFLNYNPLFNGSMVAPFAPSEFFGGAYIANSLGPEMVIQPLNYDPVTTMYTITTNSHLGTVSAGGVPPGPPAYVVPLGSLTTYAGVGGSTVTNTGFTVLNGNLGLNPGSAVVGFPPGIVTGTINVDNPAAIAAQNDLTTAYTYLATLPGATAIPADIGGMTLTPGLYAASSTLGITGTVTLNGMGNPNSIFIFQVPTALTTAVGSVVMLENGANAANIYWQIGSSATLGVGSTFNGSILAQASITVDTGATANGRLLARTAAVTLDDNIITVPAPVPPPPPGPPSSSAVMQAGTGGANPNTQPILDQQDIGIVPSATAVVGNALFPVDIILPTFNATQAYLSGSVYAIHNHDAIFPSNLAVALTFVANDTVNETAAYVVSLYGIPVDLHPQQSPEGATFLKMNQFIL